MTKNELITKIAEKHKTYSRKDVALVVQIMLNSMVDAMKNCERIEIRGFGTFSIRERKPRVGRNPKSGEQVNLVDRKTPFFKAGKGLRTKVDKNNGI